MSAHLVRKAGPADLTLLLPLIEAYHEFESIASTEAQRSEAVEPLLRDAALGSIWLIEKSGAPVGYIALCYGYSIEFGGRDAFIDEFYILPGERGQGIGTEVVDAVKAEAAAEGVLALHLEVDRNNDGARRLYERMGFRSRTQFHLMSHPLGGAAEPSE